MERFSLSTRETGDYQIMRTISGNHSDGPSFPIQLALSAGRIKVAQWHVSIVAKIVKRRFY